MFQMAPIPSSPMSSRSKKKEPRYVYLSEAKASHPHKMWTEVSSSVPHFLQVGLLVSMHHGQVMVVAWRKFGNILRKQSSRALIVLSHIKFWRGKKILILNTKIRKNNKVERLKVKVRRI
jgi:hypothetical protein